MFVFVFFLFVYVCFLSVLFFVSFFFFFFFCFGGGEVVPCNLSSVTLSFYLPICLPVCLFFYRSIYLSFAYQSFIISFPFFILYVCVCENSLPMSFYLYHHLPVLVFIYLLLHAFQSSNKFFQLISLICLSMVFTLRSLSISYTVILLLSTLIYFPTASSFQTREWRKSKMWGSNTNDRAHGKAFLSQSPDKVLSSGPEFPSSTATGEMVLEKIPFGPKNNKVYFIYRQSLFGLFFLWLFFCFCFFFFFFLLFFSCFFFFCFTFFYHQFPPFPRYFLDWRFYEFIFLLYCFPSLVNNAFLK